MESGACKKIEIKEDEKAPEGRILHAMTMHENDLYIYGGESKNGEYLDDMWKFNVKDGKWTQVELKGENPKPRSGHSLIAYNNKFYLFGGKTGNIHETNEL